MKGMEGASEEMARDQEWLEKVLDVPFCFCMVCRHQPSFGPCTVCRCGNKGNLPKVEEKA